MFSSVCQKVLDGSIFKTVCNIRGTHFLLGSALVFQLTTEALCSVQGMPFTHISQRLNALQSSRVGKISINTPTKSMRVLRYTIHIAIGLAPGAGHESASDRCPTYRYVEHCPSSRSDYTGKQSNMHPERRGLLKRMWLSLLHSLEFFGDGKLGMVRERSCSMTAHVSDVLEIYHTLLFRVASSCTLPS